MDNKSSWLDTTGDIFNLIMWLQLTKGCWNINYALTITFTHVTKVMTSSIVSFCYNGYITGPTSSLNFIPRHVPVTYVRFSIGVWSVRGESPSIDGEFSKLKVFYLCFHGVINCFCKNVAKLHRQNFSHFVKILITFFLDSNTPCGGNENLVGKGLWLGGLDR